MTIAFDFDDTLVCFTPDFCYWHDRNYGTKTFDSAFSWDTFEQSLHCTHAEFLQRLKRFYASSACQTLSRVMRPFYLLQRHYGVGHECIVITARALETRVTTLKNLEHIGAHRYIKGVVFTEGQPKVQACLEHNVSVLVDDYIKNLEECHAYGVRGVLVHYAWNKRHWEDARFGHI